MQYVQPHVTRASTSLNYPRPDGPRLHAHFAFDIDLVSEERGECALAQSSGCAEEEQEHELDGAAKVKEETMVETRRESDVAETGSETRVEKVKEEPMVVEVEEGDERHVFELRGGANDHEVSQEHTEETRGITAQRRHKQEVEDSAATVGVRAASTERDMPTLLISSKASPPSFVTSSSSHPTDSSSSSSACPATIHGETNEYETIVKVEGVSEQQEQASVLPSEQVVEPSTTQSNMRTDTEADGGGNLDERPCKPMRVPLRE